MFLVNDNYGNRDVCSVREKDLFHTEGSHEWGMVPRLVYVGVDESVTKF